MADAPTIRPLTSDDRGAWAPLWEGYLRPLATDPRELWALLEFTKDNSLDNFRSDARTLREILQSLAC